MPEATFEMKQRFIHLLPVEKALWQKWLSVNSQGWERYEYDVHIGEGITVTGEYPDWGKYLAKLLTQKRIDVLAYRQGIPWIFEVKPQAGLSAYGQLLAYRELFLRQFPTSTRPELAVVTDLLNPDEEYIYVKAGIHVFLV
jgi:hypothetical protein